jgi:methylmalonyl-CoA mutase
MGTPANKIRGYIGVKSNDGHDAAILIVADIMKKGGIEVILGGYDLSIQKFANAITQEGVHFAGISSYNGGHILFFNAVRDALWKNNYPHIHLIGGGGATITPRDIEVLEQKEGIDKIFQCGEVDSIVPYITSHYDFSVVPDDPEELTEEVRKGNCLAVSGLLNLVEEKARLETLFEERKTEFENFSEKLERYKRCLSSITPLDASGGPTVYGIAGRGGSGKSTLIDELVLRFFRDTRMEKKKLAILAIDPSSHASGGALLADRIAYMYTTDKNWVDTDRIFFRSIAARGFGHGIVRALPDMIRILKCAGYEVVVESYGIGQPDIGIANYVDKAVFVATPDIGGAMQIGKEEMLNVPEVTVVLNKNELHGARHVSSLLRGKVGEERLFHTTAVEHSNRGVDSLYQFLTAHYN